MNWPGTRGACPSYWPYGARGKQRPGDQFLRAGRGAAGEYLSEMLQLKLNWLNAPARQPLLPLAAEMATLCIDGGKKAKMRPGDILGALTGDIGLDGADIGKINVHPMHVYVAVRQAVAQKAWKQLQNGKIKGKSCRVRLLK